MEELKSPSPPKPLPLNGLCRLGEIESLSSRDTIESGWKKIRDCSAVLSYLWRLQPGSAFKHQGLCTRQHQIKNCVEKREAKRLFRFTALYFWDWTLKIQPANRIRNRLWKQIVRKTGVRPEIRRSRFCSPRSYFLNFVFWRSCDQHPTYGL